MLNWIISIKLKYLKPFNCVQINEFCSFKEATYKVLVYKSYIFNVYA